MIELVVIWLHRNSLRVLVVLLNSSSPQQIANELQLNNH